MQKRKGISLIVLVITIIVMMILAASVVITLSNTGIVERASQAVQLTDEKQVQDMAAIAWADCYIEEYRGSALVEEVTRRLASQGVSTTDWNITITDTGVTVKDKNSSWDVVYEGSLTSVEGIVDLSDVMAFNANSIYRVTVESNEFTGVIEGRLIGSEIEEDYEKYMFAVITDGQAVAFKNILDATYFFQDLKGDYTLITAVQGENEGEFGSGIVFGTENCEYTIKKIEKKEISVSGTKIYEVTPEVSVEGTSFYLKNINLDKTKKYVLECNSIYYEVYFDSPIAGNRAAFTGDTVLEFDYDDKEALVLIFGEVKGNVSIYEVGKNNNVKVEGENVLVYRNSKWTLVDGDSNGNVPKTVEGQKVEAVSTIMSPIKYEGGIDIIVESDIVYGEVGTTIVVSNAADPNVVFDAVENCKHYIMHLTLDLSAFADLTIPVEVRERATAIYVSSAVKAKYPDDDKITVK